MKRISFLQIWKVAPNLSSTRLWVSHRMSPILIRIINEISFSNKLANHVLVLCLFRLLTRAVIISVSLLVDCILFSLWVILIIYIHPLVTYFKLNLTWSLFIARLNNLLLLFLIWLSNRSRLLDVAISIFLFFIWLCKWWLMVVTSCIHLSHLLNLSLSLIKTLLFYLSSLDLQILIFILVLLGPTNWILVS